MRTNVENTLAAGHEDASVEMRKHKRYRAKSGAFAAFLNPDQMINLGHIVDISMGGLGFRYLATGELANSSPELKIFGANGSFIHIDRIPCKIIYDVEISDGVWNLLSTRRCGVQFGELTIRQQLKLEQFIEHFTADDA